MKKILILLIVFALSSLYSFSASNFTVVIDAGHGGKDYGAHRWQYNEKDFNLGVALKLGELIEHKLKNVKVIYTRKTDVFIDLNERANIANKANANLFISIHTNATPAKSTRTNGVATYILGLARSQENLEVAERENSVILLEDNYNTKYEGFDPKSPESYIIFQFMVNRYMDQSLQFASSLQRNFSNISDRKSNGVHQAGFLVLRKTSMPSALIELGFINNPNEAKFLASEDGQEKMAEAIFSGVATFKNKFDLKQSKTQAPFKRIDNKTKKQQGPILKSEIPKNSSQKSESQKIKNLNHTIKPQIKSEEFKTIQSKQQFDDNQLYFGVQFLISTKKIDKQSSRMKGLDRITMIVDNNVYKYIYGLTTNFKQAVNEQHRVRKLFKDAFVVKIKNNKRVK